jgi:nitrate reductase gamma subunit
MKEYVLAISGPIFLLCIVAIWGIIFISVWKALMQMSLFNGITAVIVALCVSLLSIIGMFTFVAGRNELQEVNGNGSSTGGSLNLILLLYAVLGIAILLLFLLRFIGKIFRSEKLKKYFEETKHCEAEHKYPFENASEVREESNEEARIRK